MSKINPYIDAKVTYRLDRLVERQAEFHLDFPIFLMGGIGADFEYSLEAQVSGNADFCQDLNLLIYDNDDLKYNGQLDGLGNLPINQIISDLQDDWKFILDDTGQHYVGKTCNFSFIFKTFCGKRKKRKN